MTAWVVIASLGGIWLLLSRWRILRLRSIRHFAGREVRGAREALETAVGDLLSLLEASPRLHREVRRLRSAREGMDPDAKAWEKALASLPTEVLLPGAMALLAAQASAIRRLRTALATQEGAQSLLGRTARSWFWDPLGMGP